MLMPSLGTMYSGVILTVVLGSETWILILMKSQKSLSQNSHDYGTFTANAQLVLLFGLRPWSQPSLSNMS